MILLIGGTSDTAPLALALARAGYPVLVSQATEAPLALPGHPRIERRRGRLDAGAMVALAQARAVEAIVDAAHPYAAAAHDTAQEAARQLGIPCLLFRRPPCALAEALAGSDRGRPGRCLVQFATDHDEAARLAFAWGEPVLVTTGSRNLAPYATASRATGIPLAVRILDDAASRAACRDAGIPPERIIAGRGPFSVAENLSALHRFGCGVLVTKESGVAGGFAEKVQAAQEADCRLVCLKRPAAPDAPAYEDPGELVAALKARVPPPAMPDPLDP
jgi:precorrin-6A/cobalt-precorrin-6A reductase